MMASGSSEGSAKGSSLVATSLTQSVDPGTGTSSTLIPASAYQPSLVAMAKGAPAEVMVLAHQPTRTVVCAAADIGAATASSASAPSPSALEKAAPRAATAIELIGFLPCPARRGWFFAR